MNNQSIFSIELHLPDDKLPGYYAQIIKGIADIVTLVDRHKTLLFVSLLSDADAIETSVARYKVHCERGIWLQLDEPGRSTIEPSQTMGHHKTG